MASTRRKSAAIALAVVGIAGLSLASAATLNINANSLGAGTELVASCDTSVDVGFVAEYDTNKYVATDVTVSDIAAACDGQEIRITLTAAGVAIGDEIVGTLDDSGEFTDALSAAYDAELIDGVAIVISG